jgi:hypothetical protein
MVRIDEGAGDTVLNAKNQHHSPPCNKVKSLTASKCSRECHEK